MLKITRLSSAGQSAEYYGKDDYYVSGEADAPGLVWGGEGAAELGFEPGSEVNPDDFRSLLEGINPDPEGPAVSQLDQRQREAAERAEGEPMVDAALEARESREAGPDALEWAAGVSRLGGEEGVGVEVSVEPDKDGVGELVSGGGDRDGLAPADVVDKSGRAEHAPGFDLTFNAPKSVSLLAMVGGDVRLDVAHRQAIGEAMAYVETHFAIYRARDEEGQVRSHIGEGLVWAQTEHGISRAGDPHRHTHVIVMNMVKTDEGDWRALESREFFKNMHLVGSIYLSALRERVNELGFVTRDGKGGEGNFEIVGFGAEQLKAFSKRTGQIEAHVEREEAETGRELSGAERQLMRKLERPFKPELPRGELEQRWQSEAKAVGLDVSGIMDQAKARGSGHHVEARFEGRASPIYSGLLKFMNPQDMPHETPRGAVLQGLSHAEERAAVFTRHDVLQAAMKAADYRFSVAEYEKAYASVVKKGEILPADKTVVGGITTARAVELERDVVDRMQAEKGGVTPFARMDVDALLTRSGFERLGIEHIPSGSQARVVEQVLRSRDGVVAVTGPAGTGKTHTFSVVARAVEDLSGGQQKLLALAPTHKAIGALRDTAGISADTVTRFLNAYTEGKAHGDLGKLAGVYGGQRLLVDEASMLSNPQMSQLLAAKGDLGITQLILSGDERQLPSVQAGAPLKLLLTNDVGNPRFMEIRRQKDETLRDAIYSLARGEPSRALPVMAPYLREVGKSDDLSLARAAVDQWKEARAQGKDAVVVVATNAMRAEVTAGIREVLISEGKVSAKGQAMEVQRSLPLTLAERANSHSYSLGQTLSVFKGDASSRTRAGDQIRIDGIDHDNNRLLGRGAGGRSFSLNLSELEKRDRLGFGLSTTETIMVAPGDRMTWTSSNAPRDIVNGAEFEVTGINRGRLTVRDAEGVERVFSRSDPALRSMSHAYAVTADKAQGQTYDHVIAVLSSRLGEFANNARAYVMASRPSESLLLLTDNVKGLFRKLGEFDGINRVALEHVNETYDRAMKGDFASRGEVKAREQAEQIEKARSLGVGEDRDAVPAMDAANPLAAAEKQKAVDAKAMASGQDKAAARDDAWNKKEKELIMPPFTAPGKGRQKDYDRGM